MDELSAVKRQMGHFVRASENRLDTADVMSDSYRMSEQWSFIERAGKKLRIGQDAIRKWRVRGVPTRHRLAIVDMASAEGFALDRVAFDDPPGPKSKSASGNVPVAAE
jgi:hypothetical protein